MKKPACLWGGHCVKALRRGWHDQSGSVIVEAAFALPLMITVLLGLVSYGSWFLTAHNVQSAANDAARAALSGLDNAERIRLVSGSIERSVLNGTSLDPSRVDVTTTLDGAYYTVTVRYDGSDTLIDPTSLLPFPSSTIERSAIVRLAAI
ncbi:TadE/TadG family type IV pilus assembly protein [Croceicoccus naphthovorans]|uniref:Uncharacterized protein n=1 Tax=Croceicoccus naphthovorans TaxID=1348774 RepID=A0A0G3XMQ2_9SPHN|nr:TadE/TadG family type IV pilus assembly protein [Croceicoccus naphthovorans]AKM11768.1 hypothetical protein AB433_11325 [Croceicoccus naphthovorans]MBB3990122.1 Flp pilus assembly protein TadG [Croceicoccus naphthovorans]